MMDGVSAKRLTDDMPRDMGCGRCDTDGVWRRLFRIMNNTKTKMLTGDVCQQTTTTT